MCDVIRAISQHDRSKMQRYAVKNLNGIEIFEKSPNGGWAWVVMLGSFAVNGFGIGTAKTLGVYFVDIKNEFGVSNTASSWFITVVLSTLMFGGLLANICMRWFDARQVVMGGGLVSGLALVIMSISSHFEVLYFAAVLSGLGFGISAITSLSQMSLYFSTWKSFANGFVLSGSTTFGAVYPFLNQYLIDECGWRGAFLVSGGIALNICAAGSLIRPISVISKKKSRENETSDCVISQPIDHLQHDKRLTSSSCFNFVIRYWVGLGFLIADFAFSMAMYAPNVFVVPYTEELGLKTSESVLLLSLLSFGDFLGRLGSGLAASKIKFLRKNVLFLMTACIFVLSGIEIFPIFYATLPFLLVYVIVYGLAIGASITLSFSVIGEILDSAVVEMAIAMMFASDGIALLVSGPATGAMVDEHGGYQAVFWYALLLMFVSGIMSLALSIVVRRSGVVVTKN